MGRWLFNLLGGIGLALIVLSAIFSKPVPMRGDPRELMKVREL